MCSILSCELNCFVSSPDFFTLYSRTDFCTRTGHPMSCFFLCDGMTAAKGNTPNITFGKRHGTASKFINCRAIGVRAICGDLNELFVS